MRRPSYRVGTIWVVVGKNSLETSTAAWVLTDHMNVEREAAWAGRFFLLDTSTIGLTIADEDRAVLAVESLAVRDDIGGVVVIREEYLSRIDQYTDGLVVVRGGKAHITREPTGISPGEAHELAKRIDWEIAVRRAVGL